MKKRGIFFSTDALVALTIIFFIVLIAFPLLQQNKKETNLHYDILKTLSSLKMGEINESAYTTDPSNSVLEQIGEHYAKGDLTSARELAEKTLQNVKTNENIGLWYSNTLIWSQNSTPYDFQSVKNIDTARQTISGIQNGTNVTGFSARAFLSSAFQKKYFYLGGYVGDGNLSANVSYDGNITNATIEMVIRTSDSYFELIINGNSAGTYQSSADEFTPVSYSIPTNDFVSGSNIIEFRGQNLHIAGGFVKISYKTQVQYEQPAKYNFAGIKGLINLYDGFYIPGTLNSLNILLHLNTSFASFLNIGNITVFNGTTNDEEIITIADAQLRELLNYDDLSEKTIPLRLGLENASFVTNSTLIADVFSVTDLSGSMGGQKIIDAKAGNNLLIDVILNYSENRVGLAGYQTIAKSLDFHPLSDDSVSLKNKVGEWNTGGWTCICCGINKAISCFDPIIMQDNFNGQSAGAYPTGWNINEGNGLIEIISPGLEGDAAASISRLASQNPSISNRFSAQEDKISAEFLINHISGSGRVKTGIEEINPGGTSYSDYIIIKMYGGWIRNNNDPVISYNLNTAYKIKIEVVPGADTYDLYVDDSLVGDNLPVYNIRSNVAGINFQTENSAVSFIADDIKIFLTNELCENPLEEGRQRSMIVMSDGQVNRACGMDPVEDYDADGDTTDDPEDHSIQAACNAYNNYGIRVHTVGFGGGADESTLQQVAACGNGTYYFADVGELAELYNQIAQDIIEATYVEQTVQSTGNISTTLYPDSYIEFNYTKTSPFGLIINAEKQFDNEYTGTFSLPPGSSVVETKAISYSGPRWTNLVGINNNTIYNLSNYGQNYIELGDPYSINIENNLVLSEQDNIVRVTTALSPQNSTSGSASNKIIYTVVKNVSSLSPISYSANGCIWNIQFEDNTTLIASLPANYSGTENCHYNEANGLVYNENDAFQTAVADILQELDFNSNNKVDVIFTEQDLQIDLTEFIGIPFAWSTEVQARVWS